MVAAPVAKQTACAAEQQGVSDTARCARSSSLQPRAHPAARPSSVLLAGASDSQPALPPTLIDPRTASCMQSGARSAVSAGQPARLDPSARKNAIRRALLRCPPLAALHTQFSCSCCTRQHTMSILRSLAPALGPQGLRRDQQSTQQQGVRKPAKKKAKDGEPGHDSGEGGLSAACVEQTWLMACRICDPQVRASRTSAKHARHRHPLTHHLARILTTTTAFRPEHTVEHMCVCMCA